LYVRVISALDIDRFVVSTYGLPYGVDMIAVPDPLSLMD